MQDIVRSRDRELSVCAEDTARLQRLVAGADRRLRLAEERWQERERLILADLAFHEEQAVAKEAAHSAELASYRSAVSDQQKRCEVLSDSLIEQQTDMAAQTAALRDQFDAGISELAAARNEAHAEAQSLRRELGEQAGLNRQEALKLRAEVDAQARRAQQLKEALVSRGEKFVVTLELLQAAVRQCVQETSEWKLKNSYLSSQMNKLLVVLGSLSAPPAARSPLFPDMTPVPGSANGPVRVNFDYTNLAEETILDSVPIALRPIRIYGDEIRRSFVMFAQRVASNSAIIGDLQGELRKTKLSLDECMFSLDEERSDLFATKKLISGAKAQTMNVERDLENKERAHRDQVHMVSSMQYSYG